MNKMNRKGQIAEGWLWIVRILLIIVPLVLTVAFFVNTFVINLDISPAEAVILSERSTNCFSDSNGIIEEKRFSDEELEKCFVFGEEGAINSILLFSDKELEVKTSQFDYLNPICELKGKNVPYCKEFRKYVLVESEGIFYPGSLDTKILLKK